MEYKLNPFFFTEIHIKIVKHLLKSYFKHLFVILAALKRRTYYFKSSHHLFLFRSKNKWSDDLK